MTLAKAKVKHICDGHGRSNSFHSNEIDFLHLAISKINISMEPLVIKFPKQVDYLVDFNKYDRQNSFDTDVLLT